MASSLIRAHMPGLDFLRGLAVLMVVTYHPLWFDAPHFVWPDRVATSLYDVTSVGWTGVNLFFVLSGFLITGNLMDSDGKRHFYSRFYIRRALRIVPVYYLIVLILALTRDMSWNYAAVCLLFLANMPGIIIHGSYWGVFPAWSLAVEEQFYLVWPLFYRRLQRRGLMLGCVLAMVLCPLLRGLAYEKVIFTGDIFSKTWMIGDNLAVGALLAGMLRSRSLSLRAIRTIGFATATGSIAVLIYMASRMPSLKENLWGASIGYSALELLCGSALIFALLLFRKQQLPRPLRAFEFLADISYGLYLIHMACAHAYDHFFGSSYLRDWRALLLRFFIVTSAAVLLATLSKRYFENPIMKLRRRIPAAR